MLQSALLAMRNFTSMNEMPLSLSDERQYFSYGYPGYYKSRCVIV